jgi:tripartite-type tricarboxylate transporter receptor subunit TctC
VEYYLWVGLFAPKGTPKPVVSTLISSLDKAAQSDLFKSAISKMGQEPTYISGDAFAKFWDVDAKAVEAAVRSIGKQG